MENRITILSPHLDDAVWSLGGYLKSLVQKKCDNNHIRVINIFSRQTFIFEKIVSPDMATIIRKEEDQLALSSIGITDIINLDIPEALLRGYQQKELFTDNTLNQTDLVVDKLLDKLLNLITLEDTVFAPAAFGGHIDHILVRDFAAIQFPGCFYYEDLPYAAREIHRKGAEYFLKDRKECKLTITAQIISDQGGLIDIYKSQISPRRHEQIVNYLSDKGLRIWK